MAVHEIKIDIPDDDVIEELHHLLNEAKSGRLQSIAYAVSYRNHLTGNGWAGMGKNNLAVLGEVTVLQHEMINAGCVSLRRQPICYDD